MLLKYISISVAPTAILQMTAPSAIYSNEFFIKEILFYQLIE